VFGRPKLGARVRRVAVVGVLAAVAVGVVTAPGEVTHEVRVSEPGNYLEVSLAGGQPVIHDTASNSLSIRRPRELPTESQHELVGPGRLEPDAAGSNLPRASSRDCAHLLLRTEWCW
jgi:hypothetical protein